jgi:hypothetical protein
MTVARVRLATVLSRETPLARVLSAPSLELLGPGPIVAGGPTLSAAPIFR